MKLHKLLLLSSILLVLFQCGIVYCENQIQYTIEVHEDGSATWIIQQEGVGISPSIDTFVSNVSMLVRTAQAKTQRNMTVPTESYLMNVNVSGSYKIVRYQFVWRAFAKIEKNQTDIGDVFEVDNFFAYLYGDGSVSVTYPGKYVAESIFPTPHEQDHSIPMLKWYGIKDFGKGEPKIVLREKSVTSGFFDEISKNLVLIFALLALIGGGSITLYYLKIRRRKAEVSALAGRAHAVEDDEERIVCLLKAAGGSLQQSAIADQYGFSRSKTSKLLKEMEGKGKIKREIRGREKVVTLLEEVKSNRG